MRCSRLDARVIILLIVGAWASTAVAKNKPSRRAAPVQLHFAWPDHLSAQVEIRGQRAAQDKAGPQSVVTLQMNATRQGNVIRVEHSFPAADSPLGGLPPVPTYTVSPDGKTVSLENPQKTAEEFLRVTQKPGEPPADDKLKAFVQQTLESETQGEWDLLVGKWAGLQLIPGQTFVNEARGAIPFAEDLTANFENRVSIGQPIPCTTSSPEKKCVELQLHAEPRKEDLPLVMDQTLRRLLSQAGRAPRGDLPRVKNFSVREDVVLVTEPETLIPHKLKVKKSIQATVLAADGKESPVSETDEIERTYSYAPAK